MGLPLVIKRGGWARYLTKSLDGTVQFVIRVGESERYEGQPGHWIEIEGETPQLERVALQLLVVGKTFEPANIRRARMKLPGRPPTDADPSAESAAPAPKPVLLQTARISVAGQQLEVSEYQLDGGVVAGWSQAVPGVGLTHVRGPEPVLLVAFGDKGDPWKRAGATQDWPEKSPATGPAPSER